MKDPNFHGRAKHRRRAQATLWMQEQADTGRTYGVRLSIEEMQAVLSPDKALQLAARLITVAERAKAAHEQDTYAENAKRERQIGTK
ncbi:hypothetical protein [Glutamicibacter arilaitensis]|uniref:hypothetical protein n=1 Tax=Glutamicibacter arilaitensis TaxID=256701 RepID=UPI003FD5DBD7